MIVLISGVSILVVYSTMLEHTCAEINLPNELVMFGPLLLNSGLLCLHLFIGGICFLASCIFSDARYSVGFGAGIPTGIVLKSERRRAVHILCCPGVFTFLQPMLLCSTTLSAGISIVLCACKLPTPRRTRVEATYNVL